MPHILFAISGHGLGHLGQTAGVIRAVKRRSPSAEITIRSELSLDYLNMFIGVPIAHIKAEDDFGVVMRDGFDIDVAATSEAYERIYADRGAIVDRAARDIARVNPDLVVANVGFIPIAASAKLGVPALGLASLDWHAILGNYWGGTRREVLEFIGSSYARADALLEFGPCSATAEWRRRIPVGSTAAIGRKRGAELRSALDLPADRRIVMCAFGNSSPPSPSSDLLSCPNTTFLVPKKWRDHPSAVSIAALRWPFIDLLSSSDFCLTKLGYGIAAESVYNQIPLLYHRRPDWYEDRALARWTGDHNRACEIDIHALDAGGLSRVIENLVRQPPRPLPAFADPEAIADVIGGFLR